MYKLLNSSAARQISNTVSRRQSLNVFGSSIARGFSTTADDDTHEDFKPKITGDAPSSIASQIESDIKSHQVFIYMKGIPEAPMCGFSNMACRILDAYEVDYGSRNVLADPELRDGIKKYTHWPTIPQVFIHGEFIGGSDILLQMHQNGELSRALEKPSSES